MNELQILNGGVDVQVTLQDGTSETVKVRQLPMRKMAAWMAALQNEPVLIELVCEKPEGWADNLTHEDHEKIMALDAELNVPFFDRCLERRQATAEKQLAQAKQQIAALESLPVAVRDKALATLGAEISKQMQKASGSEKPVPDSAS